MATFSSTSYTDRISSSNAFSSDSLLLFQSLPKHPILTEVPLLLILATIMVPHRNPSRQAHSRPHLYWQKLRPQWFHIGAQLFWQKFLLILATIMVPHRSPTNTSRRLHSRRHPIPFPLAPFYPSLSQSILYWQKFLLIFATIMVPYRSPTTDRKLLLILATIKQSLFLWLPSIPVSPSLPQMHLILAAPRRSPTNTSLWPPSIPVSPKASLWSLIFACCCGACMHIYRWTKHVLLCPMCDTSELEPLVLRRTKGMLLCCVYYTCAQELRMHFCPLPHSDLWSHIEA